MKKRLLAGFIIITFTHHVFSMNPNKNYKKSTPVQLPSTNEIHNRLNKINLAHFVKKTGFANDFGNQNITPIDVMLDLNITIVNYCKHYQDKNVDAYMEKNRPKIIKAILQDHPQALDDLKQKGLLEDS